MKALTIKNSLLIMMFIIGLTPICVCGFKNEPAGFGDIKWGDDIKNVKGMRFLYFKDAKRDISVYKREPDITYIGEARIGPIEYEFYKGKFVSVSIKINELKDFIRLKKYCFDVYGDGIEITPGLERYYWDGERTLIMLISNFEIS